MNDPDGIALLLIFCVLGVAFLVFAGLAQFLIERRDAWPHKRARANRRWAEILEDK